MRKKSITLHIFENSDLEARGQLALFPLCRPMPRLRPEFGRSNHQTGDIKKEGCPTQQDDPLF